MKGPLAPESYKVLKDLMDNDELQERLFVQGLSTDWPAVQRFKNVVANMLLDQMLKDMNQCQQTNE